MSHSQSVRITELRLPIDHSIEDLHKAIAQRLKMGEHQMLEYTLFKRSYDARGKNSIILLSYIVDVVVDDVEHVLKQFIDDKNIGPTPDTAYHFVGHADETFTEKKRPVVVGFGPCGIFVGLILAQMGLKTIVLGRGQAVR